MGRKVGVGEEEGPVRQLLNKVVVVQILQFVNKECLRNKVDSCLRNIRTHL